MRRLLWAAMLALALVAGMVGYALADIPDTHPSAPDEAHTFYGCYYAGSSAPTKPFYALDKSLGNCPNGWVEVRLVPSALP